jgi:hypothetical protein
MWQEVEGVLLAEGQNCCNTGVQQTPTQAALSPESTENLENSHYNQGNTHYSVMCETYALPDDVTKQLGYSGYSMPLSYPGLLDAKQASFQGVSCAIY